MTPDQNTNNLPVWNQLIQFVKLIYAITSTFPAEEKDGLVRRLRDSIIEVPLHLSIATRNGIQASSGDAIRNAGNALFETETLLLLCKELGFLKPKEFEAYSEELHQIGEALHNMGKRIIKKYN